MMRAVLRSLDHPERGQAIVELPIPVEEYDDVLERLAPLGIGDALKRDCRVSELASEYTILKRLEDTCINLDELDYLAKRLDSFDAGEARQFQAMAFKLGIGRVANFINLTFCCQQATVVQDLSDLEAIGRRHFLITNRCATAEELAGQDLRGIALDLIQNHQGTVTPYGAVYANGMKLEPLYDGRFFPDDQCTECVMALGLRPADAPEDTKDVVWLYLPAAQGQIDHARKRLGAEPKLSISEFALPVECAAQLGLEQETLEHINALCRSMEALSSNDREKLGAAILYAGPSNALQAVRLAENLEQFEFIPGARTPEDCGRYPGDRTRQVAGEFTEKIMFINRRISETSGI